VSGSLQSDVGLLRDTGNIFTCLTALNCASQWSWLQCASSDRHTQQQCRLQRHTRASAEFLRERIELGGLAILYGANVFFCITKSKPLLVIVHTLKARKSSGQGMLKFASIHRPPPALG